MSNTRKDGDFNLDEELRSKIAANEAGQPICDEHEDESEIDVESVLNSTKVEEIDAITSKKYGINPRLKRRPELIDSEFKFFRDKNGDINVYYNDKVNKITNLYNLLQMNLDYDDSDENFITILSSILEKVREYYGTLNTKKLRRKYELTDETIEIDGKILHRIKALRDFGDVKKGDLGGFIETEDNLKHKNDCWIYDNAKVYANAKVKNNAKIYDNTRVYGNAKIKDDAKIYGNVEIYGDAKIKDDVKITGDVTVYGKIKLDNSIKTEISGNLIINDIESIRQLSE